MTLRDALRQFLEGWRDDLAPAWRSALAQVEPAFDDVRADLKFDPVAPIYPARRNAPLPHARPDAHVFRAFDGIDPAAVRCVLVGQDPYPKIARATGRAFEQGDLQQWADGGVAMSLQRLLQMMCAARTNDKTYVAAGGWKKVLNANADGTLGTPRALFDRLQTSEGLLFLNAGLTITRYLPGGAPEQLKGHIPLWRPFVGGVLRYLATRSSGHLVLLLLGKPAQDLTDQIGVRAAAEAAGCWKKRVDEVRLPHPAATNFLPGPNPFVEVNAALQRMGSTPIAW